MPYTSFMAYPRKSASKRSQSKRKPKTRSYKSKESLGLQVAKSVGGYGLKLLKSRLGLNTETNFLDTAVGPVNLATTLTAGSYALSVPQGDTSSTRTGASVRLTSYEVNLSMIPISTNSNPGSIRVILYGQKKAVNASLVTTAQILQDNTNLRSPYNMDYEGYQILFDQTYSFNASVDSAPRHVHISAPLGIDWHLKWSNADTTGSSANLEAGYVRIAYMYEGFTAVTGIPQISSYTRIKWVDN